MTDEEIRAFLNRVYKVYPDIKTQDGMTTTQVREKWSVFLKDIAPAEAYSALDTYIKEGHGRAPFPSTLIKAKAAPKKDYWQGRDPYEIAKATYKAVTGEEWQGV